MKPFNPALYAELLTECLSVLYTLNPDTVSQQVALYDLEARCEKMITQLIGDKNAQDQTSAP